MSSQPETTLKELANLTMGQSPDSSFVNTSERGLPFLQGCAEFGARSPVAKIHCSPPLRIAKAGSILISVRAPVGTTNLADQDYCIGRGLGAVTAQQGIADSIFLLNVIEQNIAFLHRRSQGSTFLAIGAKELSELPVPDLHISEQRRVAEILATLDETIKQTEALIAKYQQIKAGLMHDLFTRGVTPDGRLRPTRDEAPHLYKQSPFGWIPKDWDFVSLSAYLDPSNGIKPGPFGSSITKDSYKSAGYRVYGQEQVIAGSLEIGDYYISAEKFSELRGFEVQANDVLISLVGTVGRVLIVEPPFEPGIINPRLMRLRPAPGIVLARFLKYLLLTSGIRRQLDILAGGGTMPVINGKVIRRLVAPLTKLEEQKQIVDRVDSIEKSIASLSDDLEKARLKKHGLMHDLLTGRVRVNVPVNVPETAAA